MGRLIDADICLHEAWQNFYKQEDEHEKNIDGYDIMRDRFYEQSGFECCQQTIVNALTIEAIPKDNVYKAIQEMMKYEHEGFINISLARLDEILKKCGVSEDGLNEKTSD